MLEYKPMSARNRELPCFELGVAIPPTQLVDCSYAAYPEKRLAPFLFPSARANSRASWRARRETKKYGR